MLSYSSAEGLGKRCACRLKLADEGSSWSDGNLSEDAGMCSGDDAVQDDAVITAIRMYRGTRLKTDISEKRLGTRAPSRQTARQIRLCGSQASHQKVMSRVRSLCASHAGTAA
jgi:hypothetical protein